MRSLFLTALACYASFFGSIPSIQTAFIAGPSGVVTDVGAIGPNGYSNGFLPGYGYRSGKGYAYDINNVYGYGGAGLIGRSIPDLGHGTSVITPGGGSITANRHGVSIKGPPTAPVVVAGPSGKIFAEGLWGPTSNIGGYGSYGFGRGYGYNWRNK